MSDRDVVIQLGSLAEPPIEPSQGFADDLWRRIEVELNSDGSPSHLGEQSIGEEVDVSVVPTTIKRALRNPVWAAAAAFALVLGTGLFVGWLALSGPGGVADPDPTNPAFTAPGHEPEPAGPEVTIAEGTYHGSTVGWQMSAFNTTEGDLCLRLSGMGCVTDMQSGEHLGALLTSYGFDAGQEALWCAYGTVRGAEAVQLRLPDGTQTIAPIFTNPDFDVDFYAYCSLGDDPANEVTALDSNGDILDVVPDTTGD